MNITVVLSANRVDAVKNGLESGGGIGLQFEYITDAFEVFTRIKDRGFYMDKLVIIPAFLADAQPAVKQSFVSNLITVCEMYLAKQTGEIIMIDGNRLLEMEYHQFLEPYPGFAYQSQRVHPSELLGLISGNLVYAENENINNDVKRPGLFSRVFRKQQPQATPQQAFQQEQPQQTFPAQQTFPLADSMQPEYSAAPLFADTFPQTQEQQVVSETPEAGIDTDALMDMSVLAGMGIGSDTITQSSNPQQTDLSDTPLFEDMEQPQQTFPTQPEQSQQVFPTSPEQSQPEQTFPTQQPHHDTTFPTQPEQTFPTQPTPQQTFPTQPAPQPQQTFPAQQAPQPQQTFVAQPPVMGGYAGSMMANYVSFFQKRSKTILVTGDRRTGISTVVSNLAEQASQDGLAVLVLDLDHDRRGQSFNFPIDCDPNDIKTTLSLYHAIKNASNISEYAIHLNGNLSLLGTSLIAEDAAVMHTHVTDEALRPLLSMAMSNYDIVLIDCPFVKLKEYTSLVAMSNYIIHCVHTDARGVINTINLLTPDMFANNTDYTVYMSKLLLLLTEFKSHFWNGTEVNESTITSYMSTLTDDQTYLSLAVLGRVPEAYDYDELMSGGNLLVMNKIHSDTFVCLWNNIAEKG